MLDRIRSGDAEVLERLVAETWAPLVRHLRALVGSTEAAEDAAQEAFVRLWQRREHWEMTSPRALVFRIGRNAAIDLLRRAEVRRRWAKAEANGVPTSPPTPEQDLERAEFESSFEEAMKTLPPKRREVFELVRQRGLSYRETSEVLELSEQTVANHMSLALRDLRSLLADFLTDGDRGEQCVPDERSRDG